MERVVVTGLGCITSTGQTVQDVWDAVNTGRSALGPAKDWDTTNWPYSIIGELPDYNPRDLIADRKLIKLMSRHDVIGLFAADAAMANSDIAAYRQTLSEEAENDFRDRSGIYVGSPGNKFEQQYDFLPLIAQSKESMAPFADNLFETVHPMWLLRNLPNNVLAYAGIAHAFKGPNENITNHVVSGGQAILEAYHAIALGQIDRALVIAYDFGSDPQTILYYGQMGLLSRDEIRSFDSQRDGTILGEGAAAILLESEAHAKKRQAKIYGEVLGGAVSSEALGLFSLDDAGLGLTQVMNETLTRLNLNKDSIACLTAHANGTLASDSSELRAIKTVFGENTGLPITGFKWSFGHTLCAAGVLEAIMTLKVLSEKTVPGIATLSHVDKEGQGLNISADHRALDGDIAFLLSRGFAGLNLCLALKAYR